MVEWDEKIKMYLYKGCTILQLFYSERRDMPTHLQNEYYWDEIERIDRIVELEGEDERDKEEFDFNAIWNMLGWGRNDKYERFSNNNMCFSLA